MNVNANHLAIWLKKFADYCEAQFFVGEGCDDEYSRDKAWEALSLEVGGLTEQERTELQAVLDVLEEWRVTVRIMDGAVYNASLWLAIAEDAGTDPASVRFAA